jgi:hypothetical protein
MLPVRRADNLSCAPIVLKSGNLNLLEPFGPVQACNGIALPSPLQPYIVFQMNQPTRCSNFSGLLLVVLNTAQHVSGILMPIIRSSTTAAVAFGLPLECGGSSAVGCGQASQPDHDQQNCYHHVPAVHQMMLLQLLSS